MESTHLQKAESQALAALDPADVAARQAELRQQRDLMFRAERKSKRVAKIKSKAFRRIHRRAKGKDGEIGLSIEEMAELDKIDGGDRVTEEKARMEITRARERATLKHSTKGGRWSQTVGGIEGLDEERNTAVREMVKREEELRRKIAGVEDSDDDDEFGSDGSEEDDEDASMDQIRKTAFDELASLDEKERIAKASGPKAKGVVGMKFMTDAVKREERKVQGSADELRRKLEKMDEMGEEQSEDDEMESDEVVGTSEQVQGNLGRMVFGPSGHQIVSRTLMSLAFTALTPLTSFIGYRHYLSINSLRLEIRRALHQTERTPRHRHFLTHTPHSISSLRRRCGSRIKSLALSRRRPAFEWQDFAQDEQSDCGQGLSGSFSFSCQSRQAQE